MVNMNIIKNYAFKQEMLFMNVSTNKKMVTNLDVLINFMLTTCGVPQTLEDFILHIDRRIN